MEHTTPSTAGCLVRPAIESTPPGALAALWNDDRGFIISAELVMIATILVIGLIAGLACVRDAVTGELFDVADAIDSLNQSYAYTGMHGCWSPRCGVHAYTSGSCYTDYEENVDNNECFFDGPCQARCETPDCVTEEIVVEPPAVIEEPTPCVEPCPTPCNDPCVQPCPTPCYVPCQPSHSGTIYYYESTPETTTQWRPLTVPGPALPGATTQVTEPSPSAVPYLPTPIW